SLDTNSTGLVTEIATGIALEQQPIKDFSYLFKRWLRTELSLREHVRSFGQFVDFIVVRKLNAYFHLMKRHSAFCAESVFCIPDEPFLYRFNVLIGGLAEDGKG